MFNFGRIAHLRNNSFHIAHLATPMAHCLLALGAVLEKKPAVQIFSETDLLGNPSKCWVTLMFHQSGNTLCFPSFLRRGFSSP